MVRQALKVNRNKMIINTITKPKVTTPKKVVTNYTALVESWETPEETFERVKRDYKITDEQLASGEVKIKLLKN